MWSLRCDPFSSGWEESFDNQFCQRANITLLPPFGEKDVKSPWAKLASDRLNEKRKELGGYKQQQDEAPKDENGKKVKGPKKETIEFNPGVHKKVALKRRQISAPTVGGIGKDLTREEASVRMQEHENNGGMGLFSKEEVQDLFWPVPSGKQLRKGGGGVEADETCSQSCLCRGHSENDIGEQESPAPNDAGENSEGNATQKESSNTGGAETEETTEPEVP
jgi:hypothetical protein